ncbi:MAG: phage tail tape measure protein [Sporolactobacillus sp.]
MTVVRKLTNRVEFVVNYSAIDQANRRMDDTKRASAEMDRSMQQAAQSANRMGAQFQESSRQTSRQADEMRNSATQTASASERIKQLDRQLDLQKSSLRASTAGLADMGKATEAMHRRASGLSDIIDVQKKKVSALKDQYAQMDGQAVKSGNALYRIRKQINEESAVLGDLQGDLAKTTRSFNKLTAAENNTFKKTSEKYKTIGTNMKDAGEGITRIFGYATMAAGVGLGYATKKAMDFQQQMSSVKSVMDPKDVKRYSGALENLAIVQGKKTKYSATEAAQAEEELVKAGVSVHDVIHGALAGSLNLATAGELNLKDAAEVASTALNAFRRDHLSVAKAADILAGAANASATDVGEMRFALQAVGPVAANVGLSFKGTSTALAVFAQHSLRGQDAGTSLKTMLSNLHPMTQSAANEFDQLGLLVFNASKAMQVLKENGVKPLSNDQGKLLNQINQLSVKMSGAKEGSKAQEKEFKNLTMQSGAVHSAFYKQNGEMKNMASVADLLRKHMKGMNAEQRQAAFYTMFGSDAIRGAGILYDEGAKGVDKMAASMDKIKAADVAAQKMRNFKGDIEQLRGSAETAGITMGSHLLPVLDAGVKSIQKVVDWFNKLSPSTQATITYVSAATAVVIGLTAAFGFLMIGMGSAFRGYSTVHSVLGKMRNRTLESSAALAEQRREMEKNTVAAENLSRAEGNVGGVGASVDVGGSGASKGSKGGFFKRLFKRGGASAVEETADDAVKTVSKGGRFLRGLGTVGKVAGSGIAAVDIISSLSGLFGKGSIGSKIGDVAGSLGGTWAGAAGGAAVGSFAGPIGTAIGGGIGAAIGSGVFSRLGKWAGGKLQSTFTGSKDTPTRPLEKGAASATKAYEKAQGTIDTKFKEMAASGSGYSKNMAKSINKAYDSIVTNAEKSAKSEESASKKNLNWFVKNGYMSNKTAKDDLTKLKDSHHSAIASAQSAADSLKKINDKRHKADVASEHAEGKEIASIRKVYSDKYGNISLTGQKYINRIERNYSADRTVIAEKYDKQREKLEGRLKKAVVGTISQSAIEQKTILGKLKNDSGKLSEQQASTIVKHARSARDGAISAADKKYKSVLDRADKERYGTGSMSKQQYDAVVKKAQKQRDDAVSAANDQWHDTVSAAKSQAKGHAQWLDWETGKVKDAWYNKITYYVGKAWNWLQNLFSGKSSSTASMANWGYSTGGSSSSSSKESSATTSAQAYNPRLNKAKAASATAADYNSHITPHAAGTLGHPGGDAMLGDGGKSEFWITPQGAAGLSPAVPTIYKDLPRGTQVLNGDDTERLLSAKAYAKGTSGFWSSVGDYLGKGFNWIKNGATSAAGYIMNKFGVGNVGNLGDLTQFTKNTAVPAVKKLLGSAISNLAHSSGAANMGDIKGVNLPGSAKSWIAKGMKLAGVSGADWAKGLAVIVQHESGGNANAVNRWDSNAKAGHPSAGLMQMIQSTFMANAVKGHKVWMNPIDQVAASIKYIERRYGSISRVPGIASMARGGKYVGYAKGTKGAGAWADKLFGGSKKKDDSQDKSSNLAISRNQATSINPTFNITINVNGNDKGMSENKIARLVQEKIEAIFGDLRQTADTGWEY